jgi:hypothetical protein
MRIKVSVPGWLIAPRVASVCFVRVKRACPQGGEGEQD